MDIATLAAKRWQQQLFVVLMCLAIFPLCWPYLFHMPNEKVVQEFLQLFCTNGKVISHKADVPLPSWAESGAYREKSIKTAWKYSFSFLKFFFGSKLRSGPERIQCISWIRFSKYPSKEQVITYLWVSALSTARTVLNEHKLFISTKLKFGSISILNSVHEGKMIMTNSF